MLKKRKVHKRINPTIDKNNIYVFCGFNDGEEKIENRLQGLKEFDLSFK